MKIIKNEIILGNCLDILKLIDDRVDLVLTDPPQYRLINKDIKLNNRKDFVRKANFDLFSSYDDFIMFTENWIKLVSNLMNKKSTMYISYAEQFSNDLINICKSCIKRFKSLLDAVSELPAVGGKN